MVSWIETYDGGMFDFNAPGESLVRINDIAVSLSRIPRFNGHSKFTYSVGQHCVLMELGLLATRPESTPLERLHILLHDAAEAFIGDMCSPIKYREDMTSFRQLETLVQSTIYNKLEIPEPTEADIKLVKEYDMRMLITEAEVLMKRTDYWKTIHRAERLPVHIQHWSETKTKTAFMQSYNKAKTNYNEYHD